jgi:diguanylate cyclase (GGDEF)-like protein/putative nucleotidyltransferase with HDIG domain
MARSIASRAGATPNRTRRKSAVKINKDLFSNLSRETKLIIVLSASLVGIVVSVLYFGLAIALLLVPVTLLAYGGYRLHVSKLELKAAQLMEANRIHLGTVEALATAIDARDQVASGHVRRTQIYAVGLGTKLGLPEPEIEALRMGALLHDIGKLAVPDHILSKTEGLSKAELDKAKIHPIVGAAILERVDFKFPVVETIRHHHEFWNGEGYPDKLAGTDIPITARVLTIADAYDSLRCSRPYRPAVTREEARQHLSKLAGSQFDPVLVQLFLKNLAALEAEVEEQGVAYVDLQTASPFIDRKAEGFVSQIKLANREAATLYEMSREFGSTVRLDETLKLFTAKVREFVPFETCAVFLVDDSTRYADIVHVVGENADKLEGKRLRIGEGATGFALKNLAPAKNVNPDLDFALEQFDFEHRYSTMVSLPLDFDGELIGAVSVYAREVERYHEEHIRILETISRIAADAIGKSKQHNEAKVHALTDPMTGLPNARSLRMQFEREVARADRSEHKLQLLMMDLDGFKAVNDTYGHKVGDLLLAEVGQVILEQLREYDFLARYGGDEFVALISDAATPDVFDLCTRIEKAVSDYRLPIDNNVYTSVGVSLGAAEYGLGCTTIDTMIAAADRAMYDRKARRKRERLKEAGTDTLVLPAPLPDSGSAADGLIVELNESHILSSAAVN